MNDTIKLLKQLMGFRPASSDIVRVNKCVDFLESYLAGSGVHTRIEKLAGRKILYAATRRTKRPAVLFNAHLDVVPADEETFRFRERNGWVWGRGSGDCLGNCAVLSRVLVKCRGTADVGAVFSTDEEIGGETSALMIKKGYRGKVVLVLDSTSAENEIAVAHKGMLTLKLIAAGKACHGSVPWQGKNAIDELIRGYMKIKPLFPAVKPDDEWVATCSANIISAGTVFNRVPDLAELVLDIRHTGTRAKARGLARKIASCSGLKTETLCLMPAVQCDKNHPVMRELRGFISRRLKRPVGVVRLNAATDARHFDVLNVPVAMLGVPYKDPHGDKERVRIRDILLYEDMLEGLCKQGFYSLTGAR